MNCDTKVRETHYQAIRIMFVEGYASFLKIPALVRGANGSLAEKFESSVRRGWDIPCGHYKASVYAGNHQMIFYDSLY